MFYVNYNINVEEKKMNLIVNKKGLELGLFLFLASHNKKQESILRSINQFQ